MSNDSDGRLRAYLDGELDPDARAELDAELEGSADLRRQLESMRALGEGVDALLRVRRREAAPDWDRFIVRARPRRWRAAALAAVAALAAALVLVWWTGRETHGDLTASTSRQTADVGERAIVVAEPGAQLQWSIDRSGDADVTQSRGAVFYRVEQGGAFEVRTPAGSVSVTGTCFTLEVVPMKEWIAKHGPGGAIGTLVGAALVLIVHEGSVVMANDEGSTEVAAGQTAQALPGAAPHLSEANDDDAPPPRTDGLAALRARDAEQRRRIAELEAALAASPTAVAAEPESASDEDRVRKCAMQVGGEECSTVDPDQDVLDEMARCGTIKVDEPEFLTKASGANFAPPADLVALVGLSEEEIAALAEVNRAFAERHAKALQQVVADLDDGKPAPIPPGAPPWAIISSFMSVLDAGAPEEQARATRAAIARERAGQATPPATLDGLPPFERYERIRAGVGDAYEAAVAEALGPDRAHELRVAGDGWGHSSLFGGDCPD